MTVFTRTASDTGLLQTGSVQAFDKHSIVDTGLSLIESVHAGHPRFITGTALTVTDSVTFVVATSGLNLSDVIIPIVPRGSWGPFDTADWYITHGTY